MFQHALTMKSLAGTSYHFFTLHCDRGQYAKPRRGASGKRLEMRLEAKLAKRETKNAQDASTVSGKCKPLQVLESLLDDLDILPTRLQKRAVSCIYFFEN